MSQLRDKLDRFRKAMDMLFNMDSMLSRMYREVEADRFWERRDLAKLYANGEFDGE